jgi:hypothetical protein
MGRAMSRARRPGIVCRRCARAGPASTQIRRRHSVIGLMHFWDVLLTNGRLLVLG